MTIELLSYLRQYTAQEHRKLDSEPGLRRLMKGISLAEYADTLARLGLAFRRAEQSMVGYGAPVVLPEYLERADAIRADLERLPKVSPPVQVPAMDIGSPWATAGVRYVLDGSSQGSRFIRQRLQRQQPAIWRLGATRYWQVQMTASGDWEALCGALTQAVSPDQAESALAGARATFRLFRTCFKDPV